MLPAPLVQSGGFLSGPHHPKSHVFLSRHGRTVAALHHPHNLRKFRLCCKWCKVKMRGMETASPLRVLDLFSGIGGFSLGLERAGMKTAAFCEISPYSYCRSRLAQHWPGVPLFDDIRSLSSQHLTAAGIAVDFICGGFPCQDVSCSGPRLGLDGTRSGLWSEYARLIGELRPRGVIVENVADLRIRGLERVLGDLAALGYDAEWDCIPASAVGAPHRRDRIWLVAYPKCQGLRSGFFQRAGQRAVELAPRRVAAALGMKSGRRGTASLSWLCWFMGLPTRWLEPTQSATPSSLSSRKSSANSGSPS